MKKIISIFLSFALLLMLSVLPVSAAANFANAVEIKENQLIRTVNEATYYFVPTEDGTHVFRAGVIDNEYMDTRAYLYDADQNELAYNWSGSDSWFIIRADLEAGKTYYLHAYSIGYPSPFNVTVVHCTHTYTGDCDRYCDYCNMERKPQSDHQYDDCGDMICNVCAYERLWYEVSHTYDACFDTECNVCHKTREASECSYSDDCDTTCNRCSHVREVTHQYDNACDAVCNRCSYERTVLDHNYEWVIDEPATCNTAGSKHEECTICHTKRNEDTGIQATGEHTYDNVCDEQCNTCLASRTAPHNYEKKTTKATTSKDGVIKNVCKKCGYTDSSATTIYKASKISLSKTSYTYNGKVQKPSVVVKDSKGKPVPSSNYTVTCASGCKNVGTYKVTIKMKGNYSGTKTLDFKINPVKTSIKSLTAAKKSLKVSITKKSTQVTGYEVQYSTSKKFTSAKAKTIKSYKTTSLTIKSLNAKKTYYVRVRTYKTVSGKKYYSDWSTAKYKKTK